MVAPRAGCQASQLPPAALLISTACTSNSPRPSTPKHRRDGAHALNWQRAPAPHHATAHSRAKGAGAGASAGDMHPRGSPITYTWLFASRSSSQAYVIGLPRGYMSLAPALAPPAHSDRPRAGCLASAAARGPACSYGLRAQRAGTWRPCRPASCACVRVCAAQRAQAQTRAAAAVARAGTHAGSWAFNGRGRAWRM